MTVLVNNAGYRLLGNFADKRTIPSFAWLNADLVVRAALQDAESGRSVSIPSLKYKAAAVVARVLPDRLLERSPAAGLSWRK